MLCLAAGATVLSLAAGEFTLEWTHSVSRTLWWERWTVSAEGLAPVEARVTGAGAGMEPPPDAIWRDGAWHYTPRIAPQREIWLADSGATAGWRLCAAGTCHVLSGTGRPLRLWAATDGCAPQRPSQIR
ncbi:DUF1850 domain-containing protein [Paracoccus sp. NSM]|uniref:DUF1850 domain-containing protein n=1 Tax=Paracoccus sp. NSM TaxID=3457784 RepID=UPI00403526B6